MKKIFLAIIQIAAGILIWYLFIKHYDYQFRTTAQYNPGVVYSELSEIKNLTFPFIYAYLCNIYSSRKIEQALQENIHFIWLSGQSKPYHNTINDFRGKRLKGKFQNIFNQVVLLLVEEGLLSLKELFVDGTKIEANANHYTFVQGTSIRTSKERIKKQLKELWKYVEKVYAEEQMLPNEPDFEAIDPEKVAQTIDTIITTEIGLIAMAYNLRKFSID